MKILEVKRCDEFDCPFFKLIINSDDDRFLGICLHDKRYITGFDQSVPKDGNWLDSEVLFVKGTFPEWCPLEEYEENIIWEVV